MKTKKTVLLLGATGTIGRATYRALAAVGHRVICPVRNPDDLPSGMTAVPCTFSSETFQDQFESHEIDAVISCIASRTGTPDSARAIDRDINKCVLAAAVANGVKHFVLLSAICVQKPKLAFQHAKLEFEADLQKAPITWSIVRPTAYFKSLSGQADRLRAGKPFLVFGNGTLTACKPISDDDLACYLVDCLDDPDKQNKILPIGGPGPAITPMEQGAMLCDALGVELKFKKVPVALMTVIMAVLSTFGLLSKRMADKAELAKIGRYYATESMLVWDTEKQAYDADGTPEYGRDTLQDHYAKLAAGELKDDRGAHAVF